MALHRRALLASLAAVVAGGCLSRDGSDPTDSSTASPASEPDYATCDPDLNPGETLHSAGGIPDDLSADRARKYAKAVEEDLVLPPPDERGDGYVSFGEENSETVAHGYLVTIEVTGGYYDGGGDGTKTGTHADLGNHIAAYFIDERVIRRAEDTTAELDPREHGEVVVCEAA